MIGIVAIMLFLVATTVFGAMLIKNRLRPRSAAVINHLARQHVHSVPMGDSDRCTP